MKPENKKSKKEFSPKRYDEICFDMGFPRDVITSPVAPETTKNFDWIAEYLKSTLKQCEEW